MSVLEMSEARKKPSIPDLAARKQAGERLVMVAVADTLTATGDWRAEAVTATFDEDERLLEKKLEARRGRTDP